jgi:preprotein translocase subunit SecD
VSGLAIVMVFMLIYYRLSGLNANVALILNIIILLGAMAYFSATLTLPGIAGIILTIGMSVDANVLIFERIREELRVGKTARAAIDTGFARAFGTILDANLTTLIAALFLFNFGTGPVKGFAVTLSIGILASVFTAVFVSRTIYMITMAGRERVETLSI